jgi:hypothetical protein
MNKLLRLYRLLNILSIDVALGSICCAAWFAELFNVDLRTYAFVSLGLTVWIIYTLDHLLDAKKIVGHASTERHRFHQQYFKLLSIAVIFAVLADLFVVFFIRKAVFQSGMALASVMIAYFLLHRFLKLFKEFVIAFLFSCGVMLPSWSIFRTIPSVDVSLIIAQFMITALINLLLFSWFDRHCDSVDKRESFVTLVGETVTQITIRILFALNGLLIVLAAFAFPQVMNNVFIIFFMNILLFILHSRPAIFEVNDRYRLLGDSIFFLPLLYYLM